VEKSRTDVPMIVHHMVGNIDTKGEIRAHVVAKPCVAPCIAGLHQFRESMDSTMKVMAKAKIDHSHHRSTCTRQPVMWSITTGTSVANMIQLLDAEMMLTTKAVVSMPLGVLALEKDACAREEAADEVDNPEKARNRRRRRDRTVEIRWMMDAVRAQAVKPAAVLSASSRLVRLSARRIMADGINTSQTVKSG